MMKQRPKRPRPDIVGSDQPQAVDALGVGEAGVGRNVVHAGSLGNPRMDQPERVGKVAPGIASPATQPSSGRPLSRLFLSCYLSDRKRGCSATPDMTKENADDLALRPTAPHRSGRAHSGSRTGG